MKVLDTFAGAGGFSLGFEQAGFEVVGAIESDKWACETFAFNHPRAKTIHSSIEDVSDSDLQSTFRHVDVLIGGPPCQGFSVCRKSNGDPTDPRNSLFKEFLRIASLYMPSFVVMENVPNILKAHTKSKKPVIDVILGELESLGYTARAQVLEATSFGVPQIRKRLFVVGSKAPIKAHFPTSTHGLRGSGVIEADQLFGSFFGSEFLPCPSLWEAISDLPKIEASEGSEEMPYTSAALNAFQEEMRQGSKLLHNHKAMNHTPRVVERFRSMKWGQSGADVPEHLRPYRRNSKEISASAYDQNNRRLHPSRPCHTIPASFYANFVHPYQHRNFTAREGARIQTFPDTYVFKGKPTVVSHKLLNREGRSEETHLCQYNQIGNAVPPLLSRAIAHHFLTAIHESPRRQPESERAQHNQILFS